MMHRILIILYLICVGYAATISPVYSNNKEAREVLVNKNNESSNNQNLHNIPTYPSYENVQPETVSSTQKTTGTTQSTAVQTHEQTSFFASLKPFLNSLLSYSTATGNYLLQFMGLTFLSTSLFGLICSYTTLCNSLGYEGRSFGNTPENLEKVASIYKLFEQYGKEKKNK